MRCPKCGGDLITDPGTCDPENSDRVKCLDCKWMWTPEVLAHTPGPWRLDVRTGMVAVYAGEKKNCLDGIDGDLVFVKYWPRRGDGNLGFVVNEQDITNAKVIAEVPEMIEALGEAWKNLVEHGCEYQHRTPEETMKKIEAILAKVTSK